MNFEQMIDMIDIGDTVTTTQHANRILRVTAVGLTAILGMNEDNTQEFKVSFKRIYKYNGEIPEHVRKKLNARTNKWYHNK